MRMTADGFARLTGLLCAVADQHASGRVVLVTEGGYHLHALAESLAASLAALDTAPDLGAGFGSAKPDPERGRRAAQEARAVQARFWRGL